MVFHAAAHFRDSYKGGRHWDELRRINVDGTAALIAAAHAAGVRRFVHTSSIAVLDGPPGTLIDETCDRLPADADDYYRSKILADDAVRVPAPASRHARVFRSARLDVGARRYRADLGGATGQ